MDSQPSLPPQLDSRSFDSFIPMGLFYKTDPAQEYQFMLRYITRLLSLIDHSDEALKVASKNPIESHFLQPNQEVTSQSARIQADARFIAEMTMRCCFSITTIIGALDYLLRLHSMGAVRLHSTSWKTVFVVCCLMGEKVWEDNYVHPSHIISQYGYLAKGGSNIPKRDYLGLQLMLVGALNWDTNTPLTRYTELVTNVMGVSVPFAVYRNLPMGYAGFVPRPLPPLPKMNIPTSRPRSATAGSDSAMFAKLPPSVATTAGKGSGYHSTSGSSTGRSTFTAS